MRGTILCNTVVLERRLPLPEWLGLAVIDALWGWIQHAPEKDRGRHRRWITKRRDELTTYAYAAEVEDGRAWGLTFADSYAMAAEHFGVTTETIRRCYKLAMRIDKDRPRLFYLSRACRDYLDREFHNPHMFCSRCRLQKVWDSTAKKHSCPDGHVDDPAAVARWRQKRQRWCDLLARYQLRRRGPDFRDNSRRRL